MSARADVRNGSTSTMMPTMPRIRPMITAGLGLRPRGNRPRPAVIIGLILGIVGIIVLVDPFRTSARADINPVGAVVLMLGSLSWAFGTFYSREADLPASGFMRTALEMITGGALLL